MELARFKYNNTTYIYVLENNTLQYKKIVNDKEVELNNFDKIIMNYISKYITVSNNDSNHLFLTKLRGYDLYLDKISGLKFFKKDNELISNNDVKNLLITLNTNYLVYNENSNNNITEKTETDKLNRRISFNNILTSVLLTISLAAFTVSISSLNESRSIEKEMDIIKSFRDEPYSYNSPNTDDYKTILENNTALEEDEKETLLKLTTQVIDELGTYINKDWLEHSNGTLNIENENSKHDSYVTTLGTWNPIDTKITMHAEKTDTQFFRKYTFYEYLLMHESIHSLCVPNNAEEGYKLCEGMTELMTIEYLNEPYGHTYNNQIIINKILMEIIGREKRLKFYFAGDIKGLEEELTSITGTLDDAKKLMALCDVQFDIEMSKKDGNLKEVNQQIIDMLSTYYEAKYKKPMEDDILIQYYLQQGDFSNNYSRDIQINDTTIISIVQMNKFYFSDEKREKNNYDEGNVQYIILKSYTKDGITKWTTEEASIFSTTIDAIKDNSYLENKELVHLIRDAQASNAGYLGTYLLQDMHNFLTNDEVNDESTIINQALFNLIGEENYKEIYTNGDIHKLINELTSITGTTDDAYYLIDSYKYMHTNKNADSSVTYHLLEQMSPYYEAKNMDISETINSLNSLNAQKNDSLPTSVGIKSR